MNIQKSVVTEIEVSDVNISLCSIGCRYCINPNGNQPEHLNHGDYECVRYGTGLIEHVRIGRWRCRQCLKDFGTGEHDER